jgi:4-amino-4-deoxy-L-arabinose transferase-like glycosyltransferase
MTRLLLWFTWPAWPLAIWTMWRWRYQLRHLFANPHLSLPLWFVVVTLFSTYLSGSSDRSLLLALPAMATLAAFALPTLQRSVSAFLDWFTLLFFSAGALIIWTVWLSMHTGIPAQPAINVSRLAPGFSPQFSAIAFSVALIATLAWGSLVKWRAGRHQSVLWKSLALPAGGATLCWLLVMTLWLPLLDFARSYAPLVVKVRSMMGDTQCVHFYGLTRAQGAAFEFHGQLRLKPVAHAQTKQSVEASECPWMIVDTQSMNSLAKVVDLSSWTQHATVRRPSDNNEDIVLFRKIAVDRRTSP